MEDKSDQKKRRVDDHDPRRRRNWRQRAEKSRNTADTAGRKTVRYLEKVYAGAHKHRAKDHYAIIFEDLKFWIIFSHLCLSTIVFTAIIHLLRE